VKLITGSRRNVSGPVNLHGAISVYVLYEGRKTSVPDPGSLGIGQKRASHPGVAVPKLLGRHVRLLRVFPLILILVGAVLLFERPAYAYADPGTGLLAIQAAGSALVATGWYLRRRVYALFHPHAAPKREPEELSSAADGEDSPHL
jgi:hypothetical protein